MIMPVIGIICTKLRYSIKTFEIGLIFIFERKIKLNHNNGSI